MMKKQKLIAILFCCALLIGASSATARRTDRDCRYYVPAVYLYLMAGYGFNADASFLTERCFINWNRQRFWTVTLNPRQTFVGTYSALEVELGEAYR